MGYTGKTLGDLNPLEPDGTNEPVSNLDDAIRQVKRYLVDTLGEPSVSGTAYDAISAAVSAEGLPVGSVIPYVANGIWIAPATFLACDGNTIGNVSSGAYYEKADYEDLFEMLKLGYGNAGTEDWANGDTVKLPIFPAFSPVNQASTITTEITGTTDNGGSLEIESANHATKPSVTAGPFSFANFTFTDPLLALQSLIFSVEYKGAHPSGNLTGCKVDDFRLRGSFGPTTNYLELSYTAAVDQSSNRAPAPWVAYLNVPAAVYPLTNNMYFKAEVSVSAADVNPVGSAAIKLTLTHAVGLPKIDSYRHIIKAYHV